MDLLPLSHIILSITLGLGILVFWVRTLVQRIRYESSDGNDRIVWLLVIVLTKFIGAQVYCCVRRPQRTRAA